MKIFKFFKKLTQFLKETKSEMKRVNWPTLRETLSYTGVVIIISIVVAIILGGFDFIFTTLMNKFVF